MNYHHRIQELKQIILLKEKLEGMIVHAVPQREQTEQILEYAEVTNNFVSSTIDDVFSSKIIPTEDFLSDFSHALKTPLAPVLAYAEMLLDEKFGPMNGEQRLRLEIIAQNAKRLQQEIERLHEKLTITNIDDVAKILRTDIDDDKVTHQVKEVEQQKIILEKINQLLVEKNIENELRIKQLDNKISNSMHQAKELKQEKFLLENTVQFAEQKIFRLTKKNLMIIAIAAVIMGGGFTINSLYVLDLVGKQYQVSNLGNMPTNYVIQNLKGDTIDTWLSWRLVSGATLHVGITNAAKHSDKIPLIKEVILSDKSIDIDDSLLHKGPKGSTSTYYVGWKGALEHVATKPTEFYIPANLEVVESGGGEGEITIILTNERNGDGYSGYTKSIADDSQNQILKSTITIYEANKLSDEQFKTILRHEFGHALGLAHSTAPEDLMAPTIQTDYPYISDCDMDSIVNLYDGGKNSQVTCEK